MKIKWVGILAIVAAVAGVVVYKVATRSNDGSATVASANRNAPRVLLYADLGEADEDCGCGQIIRSVRDAASRGVVTRENDDALGKKYKVTTNPTVVILDPSGNEDARYEGESKATLAKLRDHLTRLESAVAKR